jgi:spore coat protein U-like protein
LIDQTVGTDATATGNVVFWCTNGTPYTLGDEANPLVGDGAFSGTLVGPDNIPYTLSYNNVTGTGAGKNSPITSTISGTIANADYVNASAGNYSDTVTFTVNP